MSAMSIPFGPLLIEYDERVLRPREWTRTQSAWASELLAGLPDGPVLELCTGAGHIGLLAVHGNGRRLVAVDIDPHACAWARRNAVAHGIEAEVRHGPMARMIAPEERFPLILADPPWVPTDRVPDYPEDPRRAIDGGADGLDLARECVVVIGRHLAPEGVALLQLGTEDQIGRLRGELAAAGLEATEHRAVRGRGVVVALRRCGLPVAGVPGHEADE